MSHGTLIDFLQLATEKEALRAELVALAAKHDFSFVPDEMGDEDLDAVSGGIVMDNGSALTSGIVMDDGAALTAGIVLDNGSGKVFSPSMLKLNLGTLSSLSKLLG